ncbi:helix-turn-helix domain-containing protein [Candidatus Magnetomonas plexicatena]|uniref:helix-turn-helix domain-containing protein n=1 Tax=Candidatus Magnetomonas plexicatena TaxID=2552947 RepID=UPI001C7979FC|nr:helix-turn-helix transcriptional regulator [Nitrospirales bacterium LBB_01]
MENINIGSRIKKIRTGRHLTQRMFAKELETSAGYISEIESGKKLPGTEIMLSLMRRFNININWLLSGMGEAFNEKHVHYRVQTRGLTENLPREGLKLWLDEFWSGAKEDERTWLLVQFKKSFPDYAHWIEKNGDLLTELSLHDTGCCIRQIQEEYAMPTFSVNQKQREYGKKEPK